MSTPSRQDRPVMPIGYGVGDPKYGFEPIEWSWVVDQLTDARNYWIATRRVSGHPHVVPVWGVWLRDAFHFFTDPESLKGRNIQRDPNAAVHLESGDRVVILEGEFESCAADREVVSAYEAKYSISPGEMPDDMFRLNASKILAWLESDFPKTATRWQL